MPSCRGNARTHQQSTGPHSESSAYSGRSFIARVRAFYLGFGMNDPVTCTVCGSVGERSRQQQLTCLSAECVKEHKKRCKAVARARDRAKGKKWYYDWVCGFCGGVTKTTAGKQHDKPYECKGCRQERRAVERSKKKAAHKPTTHDRMIQRRATVDIGWCSHCGLSKRDKARTCHREACKKRQVRVWARKTQYDTCPDCGSKKFVKSNRCQPCAILLGKKKTKKRHILNKSRGVSACVVCSEWFIRAYCDSYLTCSEGCRATWTAKRRREWELDKKKKDPKFAALKRIRGQYGSQFDNYKRRLERMGRKPGSKIARGKFFEFLGYGEDELYAHLANKLELGMTMQNHGNNGWHIDHIIPAVNFDMTCESDVKQCWALSNLKPRWATTAIARANGSDMIGNINKCDRFIG